MSVTLNTTEGPIKIELFCDLAPKACENFLALAASNYYSNTKFHRVIKGFICQGGDPKGNGKGGQSIWGHPFEDEFVEGLTHNERGIVSMANSGPNTNKSQVKKKKLKKNLIKLYSLSLFLVFHHVWETQSPELCEHCVREGDIRA